MLGDVLRGDHLGYGLLSVEVGGQLITSGDKQKR